MDGAFVPSISFGMPVIESLRLRGYTDLVFDVHMMVEDPGRYVEGMREAGADIITVHQEACTHLDRVINQIKDWRAKGGSGLKPGHAGYHTGLRSGPGGHGAYHVRESGLRRTEVHPLHAGQGPRAPRRVCDRRGLSTDIQVDGGVTLGNVRQVIGAGANIIVAGSAVFKGDCAANTRAFLDIFKEYDR